jgi:hypothetical protein
MRREVASMKKQLASKFLREWNSSPAFRKKAKIVLGLGAAGVLFSGIIALVLGFYALRWVGNAVTTPELGAQVEDLRSKVLSTSADDVLNCVEATQSLMTLESLLSRPLSEKFRILQQACLESRPLPSAPDTNPEKGELG